MGTPASYYQIVFVRRSNKGLDTHRRTNVIGLVLPTFPSGVCYVCAVSAFASTLSVDSPAYSRTSVTI